LQDLMHRYIEKFVLCPNCRLPETEYKIKNELISHKCAACGAKEPVDMQHKLCNYILAENKKEKKNSKGKKVRLDPSLRSLKSPHQNDVLSPGLLYSFAGR
jgi:translation initiation factor 5